MFRFDGEQWLRETGWAYTLTVLFIGIAIRGQLLNISSQASTACKWHLNSTELMRSLEIT